MHGEVSDHWDTWTTARDWRRRLRLVVDYVAAAILDLLCVTDPTRYFEVCWCLSAVPRVQWRACPAFLRSPRRVLQEGSAAFTSGRHASWFALKNYKLGRFVRKREINAVCVLCSRTCDRAVGLLHLRGMG